MADILAECGKALMLTCVQSHFEDTQLEPSPAAYRELSTSEASADPHSFEVIVDAGGVTSSKDVIKEQTLLLMSQLNCSCMSVWWV